MMDLRERGETRLQRTDFANKFCACAEIPTALMVFFDGRTRTITESWVGQDEDESVDCSQDMLKAAERKLAVWTTLQSGEGAKNGTVDDTESTGSAMMRMQAEGYSICVGSPINDVYPALVLRQPSQHEHPKKEMLLQMGLAYVKHQLSKESYARGAWMEKLVDTAMQVLSIQFLVVRADGKVTFDSLKNLPHQIDNRDRITRNQRSFLNSTTENPELKEAVAAATSDQKRTSIVSVFTSPGVARLVVVTPLANSDMPLALVLFENDNTDHFKLRQHFFNAYRLTRAESQIAHEILSGRTMTEAAEARDLSLYTVRSYMKQVFAKTGTHKQSELVSLYFNSILPVTSDLEFAVE